MPHRPVRDTIAILHRTLGEIERELDPLSDNMALGELKRIVLNRIADLELESALQERSPGQTAPGATTLADAAQPASSPACPPSEPGKKP